MRRGKTLSKLMAMALSFSMLTACGGANEPSTTNEKPPVEVAENETTTTEVEEAAEAEETADPAAEDVGAMTDEPEEAIKDTYDTEVLVIGAGGTGLAAASSAHQNGADVLVLERQGVTGGSTSYSGGGIGSPGSRFQEENGVEDSADAWVELWKERQATSDSESIYPDYDRVKAMIEEGAYTTEWLHDEIGLNYASVDGFGVDPVERLHFPEKGGVEITKTIYDYLTNEGVEVLLNTEATELIQDENGEIVGAKAVNGDTEITINAQKVILATGGFAKNPELIERFIPEWSGSEELSAAAPGSQGDGIIMAENAGAELYEDAWIIGLGMTSPIEIPNPLKFGIEWDPTLVYVNQDGNRFVNEFSHYAIVTNEAHKNEANYVILDSSEKNADLLAELENLESEYLFKGETFEQLAEAMGVDAANLVATMEAYNNLEAEDVFGKGGELRIPLTEGPYYAIRMFPRTMGTMGGVKVDENYQVLDAEGKPIPNLYAGGEVANKFLYDQVYMTGSAVQYALTSGRIAGEHAANAIK